MRADGIGTVTGRLILGTAEKIPPSELVDTTGAGDAFIGATLYGNIYYQLLLHREQSRIIFCFVEFVSEVFCNIPSEESRNSLFLFHFLIFLPLLRFEESACAHHLFSV